MVKLKKALKILKKEEDRPTDYETDGIFEGLCLLKKIYPEGGYVVQTAEHDEIWSYGVDETLSKMTEEDVTNLAKWGWSMDNESWHTFV